MRVIDLLREALLPIDGVDPRVLDQPVPNVTSDSRESRLGSVFVAVRGTTQDGHDFIPTAIAAGAGLIIGEAQAPEEAAGRYLQVSSSRKTLAELASSFQGHPSRAMKLFGVTGTGGKTTTTYLIESMLAAAGESVGVIGTVSFRHAGKVIPSTHTTPGPVELQALLRQMRDEGATAVVMEVSSHALDMRRVSGVAFDAVVFTNLSPEHLDYHSSMESYFEAKKLLFTEVAAASAQAGKRPIACVNVDNEWGARLLRELRAGGPEGELHCLPGGAPDGVRVRGFGVAEAADFRWTGLRADLQGVSGSAQGIALQSELLGSFNAENILGAVAACEGTGVPPEAIATGVRTLRCVPGRLERVENTRGVHVLVDYAHKPDALEKVLRFLRDLRGSSRLISVFGCGGDRDRSKRPVMGRLSAELADLSFVTSDNPRTENPDAIIAEILAGIPKDALDSGRVKVDPDRRRAIFAAIAESRPGDVVLIAGKGHEDYQIIGRQKVHFDDREVAAEALK